MFFFTRGSWAPNRMICFQRWSFDARLFAIWSHASPYIFLFFHAFWYQRWVILIWESWETLVFYFLRIFWPLYAVSTAFVYKIRLQAYSNWRKVFFWSGRLSPVVAALTIHDCCHHSTLRFSMLRLKSFVQNYLLVLRNVCWFNQFVMQVSRQSLIYSVFFSQFVARNFSHRFNRLDFDGNF